MHRYTVTRKCCVGGHCSICVGGGDLANRETVIVYRTDDLALANEMAMIWTGYSPQVVTDNSVDSHRGTDDIERKTAIDPGSD